MKNPFIYGQVVSGDDFADREEELKLFQRKLLNAEKVFLISPRRYGKSSLLDKETGRYFVTDVFLKLWLKSW